MCDVVFLSKKCGFHVPARLCGWIDGGKDDDDGATYSESERMHHSLTGREQSPAKSTQYNQELLVSTEQWGRDQRISLHTQFYYHHNTKRIV